MRRVKAYFVQLILVLTVCLSATSALAQKDSTDKKERKNDSLMLNNPRYYLLLDGVVYQSAVSENGKQKPLDSVLIRVLNETDFSMDYRYTKKGKCALKLPLGKKYTIEFSKRGFVSKIIEVNAVVPRYDTFVSVFPFDIDLFQEIDGLDVAVLNEPIAKITFNNFNKTFDYDYNYTAKINNNIKKLYGEFYRLQKLNKAKK
jgi:hypothetical protein